ncbi:MAG: hypothetical protein QOE68_863 [Thermoanaerobaculia bacterium]|nr:hypothetical protein [Thermoanaerobaculia bacterium]
MRVGGLVYLGTRVFAPNSTSTPHPPLPTPREVLTETSRSAI